jgi:ABC-2 type transport system permease protein
MMRLRTTLAIARKDALDILLNKSNRMMLLTPIFIAIVFAVISNLIGIETPKVLIYNPGHSHVSQVVTRAVPQSQLISAHSPDEVVSAFAQRKPYVLGMIIPADFDTRLNRGEHALLTLYLNSNEMNEVQRQLVMDTLTQYTSSVSNPQPPVRITLTTINASTFSFNLDLNKFYVVLALFNLITVGISLVSTLLVEEKEKKTLHMLLVSPASLADVVIGKLLVGLGYQLILLGIVMVIVHGFMGNISLVLLFLLLITCFGLALSLYAGSVFQTTISMGGFLAMVGFLFMIPAIFVGPMGELFGNNLELQILHVLPTYYMADGLMNALQNQGTLSSTFLDLGVTLVCTLMCLGRAIWLLHRQAVVTATI